MRMVTIVAAALAASCAGQPAAPGADSRAPVAAGGGAAAAAAPAPDKVDAQRMADARKLGYKIVNQDGEQYFCERDAQTGSHLHRETVCLTAAQVDAVRAQTQQTLNNIMRQTAPPAGH